MQYEKKTKFMGFLFIFLFYVICFNKSKKNKIKYNTQISLIHSHTLTITHITCNQNTQNQPNFAKHLPNKI